MTKRGGKHHWQHADGAGYTPPPPGEIIDTVDVAAWANPSVVKDRGGFRLSSTRGQVYLFFWGDEWLKNPGPNPSLQDLVNDFASILAGPYQHAVTQYGCSPMSFGGAFSTTGGIGPPDTFGTIDVRTRMMVIIDFDYGIPASNDDLYFLILPPGKTYSDPNFIGFHSYFWDIRTLDYVHYAWVQFGSRDTMTYAFSHELVEAITDPRGDAVQIDPVDDNSWNEVGDVCMGAPGVRVNGVVLQPYLAKDATACVVPQNVVVKNRQITCISKSGDVQDPHSRIKAVGGISVESGKEFFVTQEHCIRDIDAGIRYFVAGSDGSKADVRVNIHFPAWAPRGSRYITTVPDHTKLDNLLSLPKCKRAPRLAEP
jgi:hypothetical protein